MAKKCTSKRRVISVGDIIIQMPPGTTVEDPEDLALALQRVLRYDVFGALDRLENTIDTGVVH